MEIHLANPRGFCAGVDRAIGIVERALELFGAPVYVRHEVVHNREKPDRFFAVGLLEIEFLAGSVTEGVEHGPRHRIHVFASAPCEDAVHKGDVSVIGNTTV
jgi:4-hydroxy-3-methylbut-2-enyl diphosphate reductase IspH